MTGTGSRIGTGEGSGTRALSRHRSPGGRRSCRPGTEPGALPTLRQCLRLRLGLRQAVERCHRLAVPALTMLGLTGALLPTTGQLGRGPSRRGPGLMRGTGTRLRWPRRRGMTARSLGKQHSSWSRGGRSGRRRMPGAGAGMTEETGAGRTTGGGRMTGTGVGSTAGGGRTTIVTGAGWTSRAGRTTWTGAGRATTRAAARAAGRTRARGVVVVTAGMSAAGIRAVGEVLLVLRMEGVAAAARHPHPPPAAAAAAAVVAAATATAAPAAGPPLAALPAGAGTGAGADALAPT